MNHEHEPKPEFNFPWNFDKHGEYIRIRTNDGAYDLRQEDTDIYTHDLCPDADHIFHTLHLNEDEVPMGFRLFRAKLDDVMGEGAFDALVGDMRRRNFFQVVADRPTEEDLHYYKQEFGCEPGVIDETETLIFRAVKNLDAEWLYVSQEPGWS